MLSSAFLVSLIKDRVAVMAALSVSSNWINLLPIITPSAVFATCAACLGVEMPKPTHTGNLANRLTLRMNLPKSGGNSLRVPVTPAIETR